LKERDVAFELFLPSLAACHPKVIMPINCKLEEHRWLSLPQEWEDAKKKQDKALDNIEKGLTTLKGIGEAMGESLNQQDVVLDTIDNKVAFWLLA
jgi:predicted flap endonuclease-1-like 5' DNA nuclease